MRELLSEIIADIKTYLEANNKPGRGIRFSSRSSFVAVGDIHGFPENIDKAVKLWEEHGLDFIIFLGDYVDRGPSGLESLLKVLGIKQSYPDRVILLRGNHEGVSMNSHYGFIEEIYKLYGRDGLDRLYDIIKRVYSTLDIYVVIKDIILVHGGVPCNRCPESNETPELEEIDKTIVRSGTFFDTYQNVDPLIVQMLWNDPRGDIEWFAPSLRGPGIYYFGRKAWKSFLNRNRLKIMIRAHEVKDGFSILLEDGKYYEGDDIIQAFPRGIEIEENRNSVITVFSSSYHIGRPGILFYYDGYIRPGFLL